MKLTEIFNLSKPESLASSRLNLNWLLLTILLTLSLNSTEARTSYADDTVTTSPDITTIVGGEPAAPGELPWHASITARTKLCEATVIDPIWILTAAHCLHDNGELVSPSQITVITGNTDKWVPEGTEQKAAVLAVYPHPDYNPDSQNYDAALLQLSRPLETTKYVAPIAPSTEDHTGENALISGFGATQQGGELSRTLQKATVPIVSQEVCQQSYGELITDAMLCAGFVDGGVDSCQGDSGGPLVVSTTTTTDTIGTTIPPTTTITNRLVGITSWGYGCAQPKFYGVYTRIKTIAGWIKNTQATTPLHSVFLPIIKK